MRGLRGTQGHCALLVRGQSPHTPSAFRRPQSADGGSSNGRTPVFGTGREGSNPSPPASLFPPFAAKHAAFYASCLPERPRRSVTSMMSERCHYSTTEARQAQSRFQVVWTFLNFTSLDA